MAKMKRRKWFEKSKFRSQQASCSLFPTLHHRPSLDNVLSGFAGVLLEVLDEQAAELSDLLVEALVASGPSLLRVEKLTGDAGAGGGDLEVEDVVVLVLDLGKLATMDGVEDGAGVLERASLAALRETGADPSGVEQPGVGIVVLDLLGKHLGVAHGVERQEGLGKAGREGGLRFEDTVFRTGHLGGVATNEVEHGLGAVELGDGREDTSCVASQQDDVRWVAGRRARNLGVADVLDGVGATGVFCQGGIVVVHGPSLRVENDVLQDRAEADRVENIGLLLG